MSNPLSVSSVAYIHKTDIEPNTELDADQIDRDMKLAVERALSVLENATDLYGDFQRSTIRRCLRSALATHANIRKLLERGEEMPMSVDVLALARLPLECLYNVCIFTEDPNWIDIYVQDGWKKQYTAYLLQKQETCNLERFRIYSQTKAPRLLTQTANTIGITSEQIATIENDQLGTPMPNGVERKAIERFPTPATVIRKLPNSCKRKMLQRLYPEYVFLCSFVHGLAIENIFKTMFDRRSRFRGLWSDDELKATFHKEVATPAYQISVLSILQSAAEIITLYPRAVDLKAGVTVAWQGLSEHTLLGKAIWNLRTRGLLGVLKSNRS